MTIGSPNPVNQEQITEFVNKIGSVLADAAEMPKSRELSLVVTKLQEAAFWAYNIDPTA